MIATNPTALRRVLTRPRYEVIPMRGALDQARHLPVGGVATVTCSPTRGVQATVELAEWIAALGHTTVPHLAARRFHSRAHLEETMVRLTTAGVQDVFVVGGDGEEQSGPFSRGADLIEALAAIRPDIRSVGIPCYPEGHAFISAEVLDEALDAKCFFAGHMVTQICFDTGVIRGWLERIRERGVHLPVHIGIPGVIERRKLLSIALRIGLGDSTRFLRKNTGVWGRLAGPSRFTPDGLINGIVNMLDDANLDIAGLHINAFNQIESTEVWRKQWLSSLAEVVDAECQAWPAIEGTPY